MKVGIVPCCLSSAGGTGPGEDARVNARGEPASYARTGRGGRSGPSAAKALSVGTTESNDADAAEGAAIKGMALRMAAAEQQDEHALHLCFSAWTNLAWGTPSSETAAPRSGPAFR